MSSFYRRLALSSASLPRLLRLIYFGINGFSLPAPRVIVRPLLWVFLAARSIYYFLARVFVCEPLFKASCTQYGRNLHTGVYMHWVQGSGRLIIGDDVMIDGKCGFIFAARYSESPLLRIGNQVRIGHLSNFTVGKEIIIGDHCMIAAGVQMFDSPGHPMDPAERKAGAPARAEDVRPIKVEDNTWIGRDAIIFPGVTIGTGSVVAAGAFVMSDVAPNVVVAGNPARVIARLAPEGVATR